MLQWFGTPDWWTQQLRTTDMMYAIFTLHRPLQPLSSQELIHRQNQPHHVFVYHPPEIHLFTTMHYDLSHWHSEPDWLQYKTHMAVINRRNPSDIPQNIFMEQYPLNPDHPVSQRIYQRLIQWMEEHEERQATAAQMHSPVNSSDSTDSLHYVDSDYSP